MTKSCIACGIPVISVDTKQKELVGNFKDAGSEWQPQGEPEVAHVHDFPTKPAQSRRRKHWMFYGSNSHAESGAAIFSLVASCRLHGTDPEQYFDDRAARAARLAQG